MSFWRPTPIAVLLLSVPTFVFSAVSLLVILRYDYISTNMGYVRGEYQVPDSVYVSLTIDKYAIRDRLSVGYHNTSVISAPGERRRLAIQPGEQLIEPAVILLESKNLDHESEIVRVARNGGGHFFAIDWRRVLLWPALAVSFLTGLMSFVLIPKFLIARLRAKLAMKRFDQGNCQACSYMMKDHGSKICPECGGHSSEMFERSRRIKKQLWIRR